MSAHPLPAVMSEARRLTLIAEIESNVERLPECGCWIWLGRLGTNGYGCRWVTEINSKHLHRVVWTLYRGEIPDGLHVCHRCDVRCCANPGHLFVGTQTQNNLDMLSKGRNRWNPDCAGERNGMAKLTDEDVAEIRASSLPGTVLGPAKGVSSTMIYFIKKGANWKRASINGESA